MGVLEAMQSQIDQLLLRVTELEANSHPQGVLVDKELTQALKELVRRENTPQFDPDRKLC